MQTVRLTPVDNSTSSSSNLCEALSKLHGRKILPSRLVNRSNLQKENSGRVTLKCELNTHGSSSELQYKPGDHVGVLASNRIDLVDAVLAKVTNAPPHDQLVKLELLKEKTTAFGILKEIKNTSIQLFFMEYYIKKAFLLNGLSMKGFRRLLFELRLLICLI